MPNYDYVCQSCGHRFEIFQSMNDAKLQDCPVEGCAGQVKRLLGTGAGVIFKGSGFYQTDYRTAPLPSRRSPPRPRRPRPHLPRRLLRKAPSERASQSGERLLRVAAWRMK